MAMMNKMLSDRSTETIISIINETQKSIPEIYEESKIPYTTIHRKIKLLLDAKMIERKVMFGRKGKYYTFKVVDDYISIKNNLISVDRSCEDIISTIKQEQKTISEIHKLVNIPRTNLYRKINELYNIGVIERKISMSDKGRVFKYILKDNCNNENTKDVKCMMKQGVIEA